MLQSHPLDTAVKGEKGHSWRVFLKGDHNAVEGNVTKNKQMDQGRY